MFSSLFITQIQYNVTTSKSFLNKIETIIPFVNPALTVPEDKLNNPQVMFPTDKKIARKRLEKVFLGQHEQ